MTAVTSWLSHNCASPRQQVFHLITSQRSDVVNELDWEFFWHCCICKESVSILQMDKMVQRALPEDLESMERGNYHNIELPDRMEKK